MAYIVLPLIWDLKVSKSVLFSLFTSSIRLISGSTVLSPQQYWYLAWIIASSAMLFSWPLYWLLKWALYSACRTVFTADILEVSAGLLYPRHICMVMGILFSFFSSSLGLISWFLIMSPQHICLLKGVLFSLFTSSLRLVSGPTIMSPQQYWYLGLEYCLPNNALI